MSKYQNTAIGGTRTRVEEIKIRTEVGKLPIVSFVEQEVVLLADGTEKKVGVGRSISFEFDPTGDYQDRNSETDELTGNYKSNLLLMNDVYGFIRQKQTEKDNEVVVRRQDIIPEPIVEPTIEVPEIPAVPELTVEPDPVTEQ